MNVALFRKDNAMGRLVDLTGQCFGKWAVLRRAESHVTPNGRARTMWLCECECGNTKEVDDVFLVCANCHVYRDLKDKTGRQGKRMMRLKILGVGANL